MVSTLKLDPQQLCALTDRVSEWHPVIPSFALESVEKLTSIQESIRIPAMERAENISGTSKRHSSETLALTNL